MVLTITYIVKYQYLGQEVRRHEPQPETPHHGQPLPCRRVPQPQFAGQPCAVLLRERTMNTTPELVALFQREREQHTREDHVARLAACTRACCKPTLIDRVARAMRGTPASC
jgi:hypothetical protein